MTVDKYGFERRVFVERYEIWEEDPETKEMKLVIKREMPEYPRRMVNVASKSKLKYLRRDKKRLLEAN